MDKQNALQTRRMLIAGADCRCQLHPLECFGGCRQQQPIAIEASYRTAKPSLPPLLWQHRWPPAGAGALAAVASSAASGCLCDPPI
jgi:hypothetical protein